MLMIMSVLMVSCEKKNSEQTARSSETNTYQVKKGDIVSTIEEEGEIAPLISVEIKSSISGRVTRLLVKEGDLVKVGQVVAEIVADREQTRSINNIVNSYREAEINFENTTRDFQHTQGLYDKSFISENEYLEAQNRLRLTTLRYNAAKEEYELALSEIEMQDESKSSFVTSPLTGVVLNRFVEEGELVSAETSMRSGTVIFNVADYTNFVVKVSINEFDIDRIRHNQEVKIIRGRTGEMEYNGKVFKISPVAELKDGVKVYPVEIEITDVDDNIRFGMTAAVRIITGRREDVIVIPVSCLFVNNQRQEYVMIKQNDGNFTEKFVKRGINNVFMVEIIEGLAEGDVIINQAAPRGAGTRQAGGSAGMPNPMGGMPAVGRR